MASYEARSHAGAAIATTLASDITAVSTTLSLTAATGWPSGASGPFSLVINRGNATEEKIDCSALSGTTITVNGGVGGRGFDSTSAAIHVAGESIILTFTARDHQEANRAVSKTVGQATAVGQVLVVDAANSFAAVQGKTSGQLLMGNGTTVVSQAVTGDVTINVSGVTAIGSGKVTSAMIVDGTIATGDIASGAITSALIADGTIATADIANLAITTALLNDSSVTSAKIVDATIATGDIADANVTYAKLEPGQRWEPGDVKWSAATSPPTGWLTCDGSSQLRASFAALFAAIGTTFGSVDGTHFTLPDARGRAPIGVGTGTGLTARALGATVGEESHTLTGAESGTPVHGHTTVAHHHSGTSGNSAFVTVQPLGPSFALAGGTGIGSMANTEDATVSVNNASAANAGSAHNTMQPSLALNLFIKT